MPKSVMFVIFLLLSALGASLTLVTGEASPVRTTADAEEPAQEPSDGDGTEAEEDAAAEAEEEQASDEGAPAAELAVLQDVQAPAVERLAAAKALLAGLEGVAGQPALVAQLGELEAGLEADPKAAPGAGFFDAVAALVAGH